MMTLVFPFFGCPPSHVSSLRDPSNPAGTHVERWRRQVPRIDESHELIKDGLHTNLPSATSFQAPSRALTHLVYKLLPLVASESVSAALLLDLYELREDLDLDALAEVLDEANIDV